MCFVIALDAINYLDVGGNGETLLRVMQDCFHYPRHTQCDAPRTAIFQFRYLGFTIKKKNQFQSVSYYDLISFCNIPMKQKKEHVFSLIIFHTRQLIHVTSTPKYICTCPSRQSTRDLLSVKR